MPTSLEVSKHWRRKRRYRADITDEAILLATSRGVKVRDSRWEHVLNSTLRVPPSGRILKVVYRTIGQRRYRIITAYWLD